MRNLEQQINTLSIPYVVLGVGIPGSGKTTRLKQLESRLEISRICPDDIREELTGDAGDQSKNPEVWEETRERVRRELEVNRSVIIDATAANAEQRKRDVQTYRNFGAQAIATIVFDIPLNVAKQRCLDRLPNRIIPDSVLEQMHSALQESPPTIEEGFDAIFHYIQ